MESRSISFFSEGVRLAGDLFLPDDLRAGEKRAGIVLCHGYTGVRNLYLPDIARVLTEAGYVVLTFDYKGWGDSEGPTSRLAPYSRVIDVQAALTWLGGAGRWWMPSGSASTAPAMAARRWSGSRRSIRG